MNNVLDYFKTLGKALAGKAHTEINWLYDHLDYIHTAYDDVLIELDKAKKTVNTVKKDVNIAKSVVKKTAKKAAKPSGK